MDNQCRPDRFWLGTYIGIIVTGTLGVTFGFRDCSGKSELIDTQPDARAIMDGIDMLNERIYNLERKLEEKAEN